MHWSVASAAALSLLLGPACKQVQREAPDTASTEQAAPAPSPPKTRTRAVRPTGTRSSKPVQAERAPKPLQMLESDADEGVYGTDFPEGAHNPTRRLAVRASSVLCERSGTCHAPAHLLDDRDATAWCEGAAGPGIGAKLTFDLQGRKQLYGIRFLNAYAKNKRVMFDNARLRKVAITVDDGRRFGVELSDQSPQHAFDPGMQMLYLYPTVTFPKPVPRTRKVIVEVLAVYPGRKHEDLCISEIDLFIRR